MSLSVASSGGSAPPPHEALPIFPEYQRYLRSILASYLRDGELWA